MKKLKEILQGIAFLFVGIPIMIMASIIDQRAFKKEMDERQKEKTRHPDYSIDLIKVVEHCSLINRGT